MDDVDESIWNTVVYTCKIEEIGHELVIVEAEKLRMGFLILLGLFLYMF